MGKVKTISIITAVIVALALIITMIATSIKVLEATEIGVVYNYSLAKLNEGKLYKQGTHATGPFTSMISYPVDLQTVDFDLQARTKDGMAIVVSVSYQYRIKNSLEDILGLLKKWGKNNHQIAFIRISQEKLRDVVSDFKASSFTSDRAIVDETMRKKLDDAFNTEFANVDNFQFLNVNFPTQYNNMISETQEVALKANQIANDQKRIEEEMNGLIARKEITKQSKIKELEAITIEDTAKIEQNIKTIENYLGSGIGYYKDKAASYGIEQVGKIELREAIRGNNEDFAGNDLKYYIRTPSSLKTAIGN